MQRGKNPSVSRTLTANRNRNRNRTNSMDFFPPINRFSYDSSALTMNDSDHIHSWNRWQSALTCLYA